MRILCLTARLPYPPDRGDRLRAYHFIRRWSAEHELTLVSFVSSRAELARVAALRPFTTAVHTLLQPPWASAWAVARNLWRPLPLQLLYYRARRMQRLVDALLAQQSFDAAYVHLFRMAPYVAHHPRLYRILDLTDVISREAAHSLPYRPPLWRALYALEQPRIARYERQAARAFDETWLISEVDRRLLAACCPEANLRLVPTALIVSASGRWAGRRRGRRWPLSATWASSTTWTRPFFWRRRFCRACGRSFRRRRCAWRAPAAIRACAAWPRGRA
jgi:polysaccharide biosynthesis protein PslH